MKIDRALGDPRVELAGGPTRATLGARIAGHARIDVNVPGLLADLRPVVAGRATDVLHLGVGHQIDHLVLTYRDHLGSEDAGRAVQCGKGLVEHGHVPTDGGRPLHQVDLLAGVRDLQSRLDAGDPSADDEGPGMRGGRVRHGRQRERDSQYGAGQDSIWTGLIRFPRVPPC